MNSGSAARPRTNARTNHGRQLERAGICACSSVSYRCAALLKRDALELGASEQGLDRDEGVTCVSLPVQSGDDGSLLLMVQKTLINHGDAHGADMQL